MSLIKPVKTINFIKSSPLSNIRVVLFLTSNIKSSPFSNILCNRTGSMHKSLLILYSSMTVSRKTPVWLSVSSPNCFCHETSSLPERTSDKPWLFRLGYLVEHFHGKWVRFIISRKTNLLPIIKFELSREN